VADNSYDLVILAAGMGSRFGGLKQVQPVGPNGELIIEYSAHDARRAGFGRLVIVIRRDMEAEWRQVVGRKLEARMDVEYVYQELQANLPGGQVPPGRTKPWGTGHAVLAAREAVRGPFAVINADDFYGASGYRAVAGHFAATPPGPRPVYALVGYTLKQTLSEHGAVSRGLCTLDARGRLAGLREITKISSTSAGIVYPDSNGLIQRLTGDEIISMNFWGFTPAVFPQLESLFGEFFSRSGLDEKAEFYLPTAIDLLRARGAAEVAVLRAADAWFGITYKADLPGARRALQALIASGRYPAVL
jgi:hypothetical protein